MSEPAAPPPALRRQKDGPWGVRWMSAENKELIAAAAQRADLSMQDWIVRAVHNEIARERQAMVPSQGDVMSLAPRPPEPPVADLPAADPVELASWLRLAREIHQAEASGELGRQSYPMIEAKRAMRARFARPAKLVTRLAIPRDD